ncbi:MAG TPA: hypothetical protein VGA56_03985 [Opitutaceae bacterium]
MKLVLKRTAILVLASTAALILSGCATRPQDSSVPWSRPADWEGRLPGVGGL